jgi:DNA gyrase/topoisomerase IV subunit A
MKIKKIRTIKLESPIPFYDITVEKHHNFIIGDSRIVCHNSSMSQAISKLARPFGCSDQIILGDGFFGTPVNPVPSAPRYTQVKISSKYKEIIEKYKDLNVPNEEGGHDWIHVDYPIGLSTHIVGIAVGYKSNILPRKPEDVVKYLGGDMAKKLKPHFRGFKGKISRVDSLKCAWLIEGETEVDLISRTIKINSISPLQRYESFFSGLNSVLEKSMLNYRMDNFSTGEVKISIKFRCSDTEFKEISDKIIKETKQIVTENIVFVKDGSVLEYEEIEEYLKDFSVLREETLLKRLQKDLEYLQFDLEYLEAKLKFLLFMAEKKRTAPEVEGFLIPYKKEISRKLENISLVKLTKEEINKTKEEINSCKSTIKNKIVNIKKQILKLKETQKENSLRSKRGKKTISLLDSSLQTEGYHNGIKIWNPSEEIIQEKQEQKIENE